jgi:hypothetical protein
MRETPKPPILWPLSPLEIALARIAAEDDAAIRRIIKEAFRDAPR